MSKQVKFDGKQWTVTCAECGKVFVDGAKNGTRAGMDAESSGVEVESPDILNRVYYCSKGCFDKARAPESDVQETCKDCEFYRESIVGD